MRYAVGVSKLLYPQNLAYVGPMADALLASAAMTAKAAAKTYKAATRKRGYSALRPGPETPLWNELARACQQDLTRYGEKAKLARILGVPRQRIHLLLVAKRACPDAERTLQLLAWLTARRRGIDPA